MIISFMSSHGGSSARYIVDAIESGQLDAQVGGFIVNNKDSEIYQWCIDKGYEVEHISGKTHQDEDSAICAALDKWNTGLVVLSGYMKKIKEKTLRKYKGKILNVHPALLPMYKGLYGDNVHKAVLAARDYLSGATIHYVTEDYDSGPIILQKEVQVYSDDNVQSLKKRVMAIEPPLYVEAIVKVIAA